MKVRKLIVWIGLGWVLVAVGIVVFPKHIHKQSGPDCLLLRYLDHPDDALHPYTYVLACPEGMASGPTWQDIADTWRKGVIVPYDHERVWRP